jgi:sporulation protein YlmC with PRC-barrel domain
MSYRHDVKIVNCKLNSILFYFVIKEYRSIIGTPILHFDEGTLLAFIKDVVIDPDTGKIEAFWVKPLTVPISDAVIQSQDILEWKKNIYIKNESVISEPADIIRISDILAKQIYIIGNRVQNEAGDSYGRVYSIDFKTDTFYIRQIYVQKSILGLINYDGRIFSFDNIIEITPSAIIIDDKTATKEKVVKSILAEDPSA